MTEDDSQATNNLYGSLLHRSGCVTLLLVRPPMASSLLGHTDCELLSS